MLVSKIGTNLSLVIGSAMYAIFVAANITFNIYSLFISSAFNGFGAAILWTAQGVYISRCSMLHEQVGGLPSSSSLGYFNGLFWSFFQFSQFGGNLLAAILYTNNVSTSIIFVIMTAICVLGVLSLVFLKNLDKISVESSPTKHTQKGNDKDKAKEVMVMIREQFSIIFQVKMLSIIPIICFTGLCQAFVYGEFPTLIDDKEWKFYVLATFGIADVLTSYIIGHVSDTVGRLPCIVVGVLFNTATILFLYVWTISQANLWIFFVCAIGLGVGDAVFNTQTYAITATFYEHQTEAAFANLKLFQAGCSAIAFLYDNAFGLNTKALIVLAAQAFGVLVLLLCHFCVQKLDKEKGKQQTFVEADYVAVPDDLMVHHDQNA